MSKPTHQWTRIAPAKWEDAWQERLWFLGPERVAFVTWPHSRSMKIEAFCDEKTALRLIKDFGGRCKKISKDIWSGEAQAPRRPLSIRGRLKIFSDESGWALWERAQPRGVLIPAGMAFGTGEHATTATCLRLLCDVSKDLPPNFRAADLGTGTGILAIAAEELGAGHVFAMDNDPAAVRITKANARINRCKRITTTCGSVLDWQPEELQDIITANLFSELLIEAAPIIARALRKAGLFIFSGVLKTQAPDVVRALQGEGFEIVKVIDRGKWCAGLARRAGKMRSSDK